MICDIDTDDNHLRILCVDLQIVIFSVDYRCDMRCLCINILTRRLD